LLMKRSTVLVFFLIYCLLTAKAQESYLGKTQKEIKNILYQNNYVLLGNVVPLGDAIQMNFGYFDTSKSGDYDKNHAKINDIPDNTTPTATLSCIMEHDTCVKYIVGYMPENVPKILEYLNKKYKKTYNNHWVDQKGLYEAGAYKIGEAFAIEFTKIDNN